MVIDKKEVISLMMRMRILIKNEFGAAPSLRDEDSAIQYYRLGTKSKQSDLLQLAKQLEKLISIPAAEVLSSSSPQPVYQSQITVKEQAQAHQTIVAQHDPIEQGTQDSDRFIEILASDLIDKPVRIIHPSINFLILDKPSRKYYSSASLQEIILIEDISKVRMQIEPISLSEVSVLCDENGASRLSKLLWTCGLKMSKGELLSHLKPYHAFRFSRWPEFFMAPEHTKLAIFLSKNPNSIDSLVEQMNVSRNEAIGFLNASFLCGALEGISSTPVMMTSSQKLHENPERKSIISRIREKLRKLT